MIRPDPKLSAPSPFRRIFLAAVALAMLAAGLTAAEPADEKQKIEALITHVENLKGARFVRNDKEYDAKDAARFLRAKWEAGGDKIKTARDFIEMAASASSTSGKPYLIRFEGGKETKSGEYLLAELKKLEK
jgi:hypothetical protein